MMIPLVCWYSYDGPTGLLVQVTMVLLVHSYGSLTCHTVNGPIGLLVLVNGPTGLLI